MLPQDIWDYVMANLLGFFSVFGVVVFVWTFLGAPFSWLFRTFWSIFLPRKLTSITHD